MTPEEQRKLAIECGADEEREIPSKLIFYTFGVSNLAAYTAAVEARERARCCKAHEGWKLVPVEPTQKMCEVYQTWVREGLQYMDIGIIKAIIEAAPEELYK